MISKEAKMLLIEHLGLCKVLSVVKLFRSQVTTTLFLNHPKTTSSKSKRS